MRSRRETTLGVIDQFPALDSCSVASETCFVGRRRGEGGTRTFRKKGVPPSATYLPSVYQLRDGVQVPLEKGNMHFMTIWTSSSHSSIGSMWMHLREPGVGGCFLFHFFKTAWR